MLLASHCSCGATTSRSVPSHMFSASAPVPRWPGWREHMLRPHMLDGARFPSSVCFSMLLMPYYSLLFDFLPHFLPASNFQAFPLLHHLHLQPHSQHMISSVPSSRGCQYSRPHPCLYLWLITPPSCCFLKSIPPPLSAPACPDRAPSERPLSDIFSISPFLLIPH